MRDVPSDGDTLKLNERACLQWTSSGWQTKGLEATESVATLCSILTITCQHANMLNYTLRWRQYNYTCLVSLVLYLNAVLCLSTASHSSACVADESIHFFSIMTSNVIRVEL